MSASPGQSLRRRRHLATLVTAGVLALLWAPPFGGGGGLQGVDKIVHAALFAAIAASWRFARVGALHTVALVGALAPFSEWVQGVLPWPRTPEWGDVAADLVGVGLGLFFAFGVSRRSSSPVRRD